MNRGLWPRSTDAATAAAVLQRFDAALRDNTSHIAPAPLPMTQLLVVLDEWNSSAAQRRPLPEALSMLRLEIFHAPGRDTEMRQLWRTALATATAAWQLAQDCDCRAAEAALAGLLHRAGAARLFSLVAQQETIWGLQLHAALRRQLEVVHEATLRDALLSAWEVPPTAARAASGWRAAIDATTAPRIAQLIYLAQLLASEALQPQFCPPALASGVAGQLRVSTERLRAARTAVSFLG